VLDKELEIDYNKSNLPFLLFEEQKYNMANWFGTQVSKVKTTVGNVPSTVAKKRKELMKRDAAEHQYKLRQAKKILKKRKQLETIRKAHAPPKGYAFMITPSIGIKKKKQSKTLSRKSRIRLI
jgi:hypothetical protein